MAFVLSSHHWRTLLEMQYELMKPRLTHYCYTEVEESPWCCYLRTGKI